MTDRVSSRPLAPRRWRWSRLHWLWPIGVVVYLAAITAAGWTETAEALRDTRLRWIAAMVVIELCALGVRAAKWRIALGPRSDATAQCFISKAGGNLTPGRIGELSPLLLEKYRTPRTGAWIVLDRCLEAAMTLLLGAAGIVYISNVDARESIAVWTLALFAALTAGTFALTRARFAAGLRRVLAPTARSGLWRRTASFVCDAADECVALGGRTPILLGMTLVATVLDLLVGFALYASFGFEVSLFVLAVAQCAHALTSAIPISPNATGIPYAAAATVLNQAAGIPLDVLIAAIAVRVVAGNGVFWSAFLVATRSAWSPSRFQDQGALFDYLGSGGDLYAYDAQALDTLRSVAGDAGRALDVGCGDGLIGAHLEGNVMGIEVSQRCARRACERGVPCVVGDAQQALPFRENSFDTVLCIDVLHHLDRDWKELLSGFAAVLRPGGRLIAIEPDARNPFVRWTQAPHSPIRVAPWANEPAIHPEALEAALESMKFTFECDSIQLEGAQSVRDVFPLWQRLLKAPFVLALSWLYRGRPNKFAIVATKPER